MRCGPVMTPSCPPCHCLTPSRPWMPTGWFWARRSGPACARCRPRKASPPTCCCAPMSARVPPISPTMRRSSSTSAVRFRWWTATRWRSRSPLSSICCWPKRLCTGERVASASKGRCRHRRAPDRTGAALLAGGAAVHRRRRLRRSLRRRRGGTRALRCAVVGLGTRRHRSGVRGRRSALGGRQRRRHAAPRRRPDLAAGLPGRKRRRAGDRQPAEGRPAPRGGAGGVVRAAGGAGFCIGDDHRRAGAHGARRRIGGHRHRSGGPHRLTRSPSRVAAIGQVSWHVVTDRARLRLHDTAAGAVRDFVPLRPGHVSIYQCGATPQGLPHIGHIRSGVAFDILRRWLIARGYDVAFIRNVTDIEDKILNKAAAAGRPWWEWAATYERAFSAAYDALDVMPPSAEPRATGHITQMIELMEILIESGHAYAAGGDVYFDVLSYPEYGQLSGHKIDDVHQGEGVATGKRDQRDFTLWQGEKPGEPSWPSPWGRGRPGWHLECSAMARTYLGPEFDIHCGGMDLLFPHHENEIAQSRAAGDGFARYWLHNGWVTMGGEKMSKSLGNSLLATDVLTRVRPAELRYYLVQAHYRSMLEFSEEALDEAAAAYQRIERFVLRAAEVLGSLGPEYATDEGEGLPTAFRSAMDEDLAVPAALAAVHACVRDGNQALAASDKTGARASLIQLRAMLDVLGLDPLAPHWSGASVGASAGSGERLRQVVGSLVRLTLDQRDAARARRDYATADAIRDGLEDIGVVVEDTPQGPRWELKR